MGRRRGPTGPRVREQGDRLVIPVYYQPVADQMLQNMAVTGYQIISPEGVDITRDILREGFEANTRFNDLMAKEKARWQQEKDRHLEALRSTRRERSSPRT